MAKNGKPSDRAALGPMTVERALDDIVTALIKVDVGLSDSAVPNFWAAIKDQVQQGPSDDWAVYIHMLTQFVDGYVASLSEDEVIELCIALERKSKKTLARKLQQRLISRAKKEPVGYPPFEFEYFCYPLLARVAR